jgi:hypothetical protein
MGEVMNDLIEMVEDLQKIQSLVLDDPLLETAVEHILQKYEERLAAYEADMERQYEMELA